MCSYRDEIFVYGEHKIAGRNTQPCKYISVPMERALGCQGCGPVWLWPIWTPLSILISITHYNSVMVVQLIIKVINRLLTLQVSFHLGNKRSRGLIPHLGTWPLSTIQMEDRLRHASGPVRSSDINRNSRSNNNQL